MNGRGRDIVEMRSSVTPEGRHIDRGADVDEPEPSAALLLPPLSKTAKPAEAGFAVSKRLPAYFLSCLLYTSDAADEL